MLAVSAPSPCRPWRGSRRRFTGGVLPLPRYSGRPSKAVRVGHPNMGKSSHPTLIPGGLERIRLRCRDVSSFPSSGPVYGGPSTGTVLASMEYHGTRLQNEKMCRTRFLPSLLAPLVEEEASALPFGETASSVGVEISRRISIESYETNGRFARIGCSKWMISYSTSTCRSP